MLKKEKLMNSFLFMKFELFQGGLFSLFTMIFEANLFELASLYLEELLFQFLIFFSVKIFVIKDLKIINTISSISYGNF